MSSVLNGQDYLSAWGLNDEPQATLRNQVPAFFNLEDLDDEDQVSEWMSDAIETLRNQTVGFSRRAVENLMFYKGVQLKGTRHPENFVELNNYAQTNDISINIIYEFVETWVNRMSKYKADITVKPSNNDTSARDNAEAKEIALKDYIAKNRVNRLITDWQRQTKQFGESFVHVSWDYDKGAIDPQFQEIADKFKGLKRVTTPSGDEVNVDRLPRVGDVKVELIPPIFVLYEDRDWTDIDYVILDIPTNADKLRSDYPDIDISGEGDISCFYMYHLPTKYLQKGRFVKMAAGEILENTDFPYSKPMLPVIKMTDIDVTGSSRGKSFIENIKPHQVIINEAVSEAWNSMRRSLKGKWVYQAKTVNERHLSPASPGIGYHGSQPPNFVQYPGLSSEDIRFIEMLREWAEQQARIQSIVQGTPPPNVRSGLQFAQLEEKERESVDDPIEKRNQGIIDLCEVISLIMAKFYREGDGRTVTIYGKDKEYLTQALKVDALKEDHAVTIGNTDMIPGGKASQLSFYSDLRQQFGNNVVPDEMLIDMLDSGRFNMYTEFGGATVETTLAQISGILSGREPEAPEEHEDLVLKWKIVVGYMRKRAYLTFEPEVKEGLKDMLLAIEELIVNKPGKTPAMQEQLAMLTDFPVLWKPGINEFVPEQPVMPLGAEGQISPEEEAELQQLEQQAQGAE